MQHFIKNLLDNKLTRKIDRRIFIYLVFVAISSVFWLLNELSGNYNTYINYPVKFTNLPQNKVLVNDLPEKLNLNVTAYGYTLLRYKLSPANYPIIINMEEFGNNFGNQKSKQFKLQTRFLRETISRQMPSDIEVIDILPDTIQFQFATLASKKVPIKPNVKLYFDEQCMLNGEIGFKPDSILISGPNTILDTLKAVYNKFKEFTGLSSQTEQVLNLQPINKIEFDIKKASIQLPISKFTQANFEIPILAKNVPDSLEIKTFPRMAKITCQIALNEYDKVQAKDFIVIIDYSDVASLLSNKLSLKLELVPAKAKLVTFFPESVEFILDKKQ